MAPTAWIAHLKRCAEQFKKMKAKRPPKAPKGLKRLRERWAGGP